MIFRCPANECIVVNPKSLRKKTIPIQSTKVVHIIGRLIPGGVEQRTLELIRATNSDKLKHYVWVTSGREGSLDDAYRRAGARIYYGNVKSPTFPKQFFRFLRGSSIDVVHSNIMYASGLILAIAKSAGVDKRIAHFRSDGKPEQSLARPARLKQNVLRLLIDKYATHIVGLTPALLSIAWKESWRNDQRCQVISNGISVVDYRTFLPQPDLQEFGEKQIIVHVGRGDLPTKNRDKAIRILSVLRHKYKADAQLVFVGRDGLDAGTCDLNRTRWNAIADQHSVASYVSFLGERSDVLAILAGSDAFLFTSLLEGLPGALLEARASGLPIVASDLPGVRFIGNAFPDIKILSAESEDEVWADALMIALESKRETRSARQQQFEKSEFYFEVAVHKYMTLWQ